MGGRQEETQKNVEKAAGYVAVCRLLADIRLLVG